MPYLLSNRSLAALHFCGLPTMTGTMWVSLGMIGNAATPNADFTRAVRCWWRSRAHRETLRCRTAAVAAAHTGGGKAVVKMNPGAYDRTASTRFAVPAM